MLIAVVVGIIVLVYLYRQKLGLSGPPADSTQVGMQYDQSGPSPPHIVWQTVDRSQDGFSVDMPLDVKSIEVPAYNERGGTEQVKMLFANPDAQTTFAISWADHPPVTRASGDQVEQTLDTARNDALARTQSTLVSESRGTVQGYPMRDFSGRNAGGGVFSARLVLAGPRLYMLIATFPADSARREQDVIRFFNSFKITGG